MSCVVGSGTQVPPGQADWSHSDGRKVAGNNSSFTSLFFYFALFTCNDVDVDVDPIILHFHVFFTTPASN